MNYTDLPISVQNRVKELREENKRPLIIKARLKEEFDILVSVTDIEKWMKRDELKPKIEVVETRPIIFNISEFLEKFGIEKLDNPDDVLQAIQTLTKQIFILESAIRIEKLQAHIELGEKYPSDSKAYRNAFEVFSQAIALKDIVSIRQAIRTIENEGYAIKMIEESE